MTPIFGLGATFAVMFDVWIILVATAVLSHVYRPYSFIAKATNLPELLLWLPCNSVGHAPFILSDYSLRFGTDPN